MAELVLFHHVLGLSKGVEALADEFRSAGHTVHVPDLFEGRTFPSIDEGIAHVRQLGFGTVAERGVAAAERLGRTELVYAGISLGVMAAQQLAQTRAGARGALLFEAAITVSEFSETWPAGVPVQVHGMDNDPSFAGEGDLDAARELVKQADQGELFLYPGDKHLFLDSTLPSYDETAARLVVQRSLAFLDALG